jgi:2-polyprenyl-6-methoxyphenol hydroxylase-like FAD-dependent oxidoreductase
MSTFHDVVVVGAGPTGLLLAGDLAAAGVSVALLERRPENENNLTRAFAVHARTLEVLDAAGSPTSSSAGALALTSCSSCAVSASIWGRFPAVTRSS